MSRIKFSKSIDQSEFVTLLRSRIENYFVDTNQSKHANAAMITKSIIGVVIWVTTYYLYFVLQLTAWQFILLYILNGLAQLFMTFNIAHDANHGSYSSSQRTNKILSYTFDITGVNSYMWRLMHNQSHHSFVNIENVDVAIESRLMRFAPSQKRLKVHLYQHIYAPILYCLATLNWVLIKDYDWFFVRKEKINSDGPLRHPFKEIFTLFFFKLFYYTYMLVIPILYLPYSWGTIVLAFFLMHCVIGFLIALIFQTTHVIEGTTYPATVNGRVENNYVEHIIETTADYAWRSPVTNYLLGCLNVHVIHHIYPKICHVHYPALTVIVKQTAEEMGVVYREHRTILAAFKAHLKMLKHLGQTA